VTVEIEIPLSTGGAIGANLGGEPGNPTVVFAHGSGSSRHSSRNRQVAAVLEDAGFETLLLDLLTEAEDRIDVVTREHRFDIDLLTNRVLAGMVWLEERGAGDSIGLFGASTGAAAALRAAAARPDMTRAVVSRGGRPDLAGTEALRRVEAPTILIVGGNDPQVLELNRDALRYLDDQSEISVIPGATHLFEEPGKLDAVADLASAWFQRHLWGE
jgi:putative phosphoribosyl transferase